MGLGKLIWMGQCLPIRPTYVKVHKQLIPECSRKRRNDLKRLHYQGEKRRWGRLVEWLKMQRMLHNVNFSRYQPDHQTLIPQKMCFILWATSCAKMVWRKTSPKKLLNSFVGKLKTIIEFLLSYQMKNNRNYEQHICMLSLHQKGTE